MKRLMKSLVVGTFLMVAWYGQSANAYYVGGPTVTTVTRTTTVTQAHMAQPYYGGVYASPYGGGGYGYGGGYGGYGGGYGYGYGYGGGYGYGYGYGYMGYPYPYPYRPYPYRPCGRCARGFTSVAVGFRGPYGGFVGVRVNSSPYGTSVGVGVGVPFI